MKGRKKYYFQLILISVGALFLSYGLSQLPTRFFATSHFWIPTLFFALTTLGANVILTRGDQLPKEFIFKGLALTMARLLVCMIVVFAYSLVNKELTLAFACHFMIQYLIFTVFELTSLLNHIKQK